VRQQLSSAKFSGPRLLALKRSRPAFASIGSPSQRKYSVTLYSPIVGHGRARPSPYFHHSYPTLHKAWPWSSFLRRLIVRQAFTLSSLLQCLFTRPLLRFLYLLDYRDLTALLNIILSTHIPPTLVNSWRQLLSNCISCLTNPRSRKWRFFFLSFVFMGRDGSFSLFRLFFTLRYFLLTSSATYIYSLSVVL
jgi:hypothetical protein